MVSRLILCFGTPQSGLGVYRSLVSQLSIVKDISADFYKVNPLTRARGHVGSVFFNDLRSLLCRTEDSSNVYFLACHGLNFEFEQLLKELGAIQNLSVHPVFLVRHPFEVAGRPGEIAPARRVLDWCLEISNACNLSNCHLTTFDELLADPLHALNVFFQTIPDDRLKGGICDPAVRNRLLISAQPFKRSCFSSDSFLLEDHRYGFFSRLYSYIKQQRFYSAGQMRCLMKMVLSVFRQPESVEFELVKEANFCRGLSDFEAMNGTVNCSGFFGIDDKVLEDGFFRVIDLLRPKCVIWESLLAIAEDARKNKKPFVAGVIYRFLLLIDPLSPAALTGHGLSQNDLKCWGAAIPSWDMLFLVLENSGSPPTLAQNNGRSACLKALASDIGYVFKKPAGDIALLREHVVNNPGASGHSAFMRTSSYLAKSFSEQAGALLVNDTRTQVNIGCYATTNELLLGLAETGIRVSYTLTLIELSLLADLLFSPGFPVQSGDFDFFLRRFSTCPEFAIYRDLLSRHRVLIINGEGSFYDRQRKGLIICIIAAYAKQFFGSRVYCVNHSADLHDELMRVWVYKAYQHCDFISLRDHVSYKRLPEEFRCFDIQLVPDAAYGVVQRKRVTEADFFHGFDQVTAKKFSRPYVVVSGTSSIFRVDRDGFLEHHVLAFNSLLGSIIDMGFQIVLMASDVSDYKLLRQAALNLDLPVVSPTISVSSALNLFSDATAFISGRWHASIIASCAGCPSILGDANFFKTTALHESCRYPWPMFDFRNLANDEAKIILALQHCQNEKLRWNLLDDAKKSASQVIAMLNNLSCS